MKAVFFLLAPLAFLFSSCGTCTNGTGEVQPEERLVQEFSALELNCSANVVIRERLLSEKNKVVVEAQANLLPLIITRVTGEKLTIDMEGCVNSSKDITIYVYVNEISKITNEGSGSINSENLLSSDQFEINHNSSGGMKLKIKANDVDVNQDGSGSIVLDGNADRLSIDADGSGSCDAMDMKTNEAEVNLHGSGSVSVYATKVLDLKLKGSGSITYSGKPEKLNTTDDGSGEIHEAQ